MLLFFTGCVWVCIHIGSAWEASCAQEQWQRPHWWASVHLSLHLREYEDLRTESLSLCLQRRPVGGGPSLPAMRDPGCPPQSPARAGPSPQRRSGSTSGPAAPGAASAAGGWSRSAGSAPSAWRCTGPGGHSHSWTGVSWRCWSAPGREDGRQGLSEPPSLPSSPLLTHWPCLSLYCRSMTSPRFTRAIGKLATWPWTRCTRWIQSDWHQRQQPRKGSWPPVRTRGCSFVLF